VPALEKMIRDNFGLVNDSLFSRANYLADKLRHAPG
jgi:hypothetical protein